MAKATNRPEFIVVHHTLVSYDVNPRQFSATNNYHKGQGFPKSSKGFYVGYHAMVEKDGSLVTARVDTESGAHTKEDNMNFRSVAICFTGNFDMEEPTLEQCKTALQWIRAKQGVFGIVDSKVLPHREWAPKSCWGSKMPDDILGYLVRRVGDAEQAIPEWAEEAYKAAEKRGYTRSNPREIVGTARLRHDIDKLFPGKNVIALKDAPVMQMEWINAHFKGGAFN